MNSSISEPTERVRKRDQLRSFLQLKTSSIRQEFSNYYNQTPPLAPSRSMSFQSNNSLERSETQEMDAIMQMPEVVQPQCIVFPTYACQVLYEEKLMYKIMLAGWAFAKPASTRLDKLLLSE
jgi:hypothetical protein